MEKNKVLDLFPCKCCGNLLKLKIVNNFIHIFCSDENVNNACIYYYDFCKLDKIPNNKCKLDEIEAIQNEDLLFQRIIELITDILRDSKNGDCYLRLVSGRIRILFKKFPESWLHGKLNDINIGEYYRIFKSEEYYKKALIIHAKKNGMTEELKLEFNRLGLDASEIV